MTIPQRPKRAEPIPRREYTLQTVFELELLDTPHLLVPYKGKHHPLQIGHLLFEQILQIPGVAQTRWRYSHTTYEWIPIFHFVTDCESSLKLHEFLIGQVRSPEAWIRQYFSEEETRILTFKGFPFYDEEQSFDLKESDFF